MIMTKQESMLYYTHIDMEELEMKQQKFWKYLLIGFFIIHRLLDALFLFPHIFERFPALFLKYGSSCPDHAGSQMYIHLKAVAVVLENEKNIISFCSAVLWDLTTAWIKSVNI